MGADPALIRRQIEQTRAEMGETIDAIAYKVDVQARAKEKVADVVDRARESVSETASTIKDAVAGTASSIKERAGRDPS